jgi:hypothetical protein
VKFSVRVFFFSLCVLSVEKQFRIEEMKKHPRHRYSGFSRCTVTQHTDVFHFFPQRFYHKNSPAQEVDISKIQPSAKTLSILVIKAHIDGEALEAFHFGCRKELTLSKSRKQDIYVKQNGLLCKIRIVFCGHQV